MDVLMPWNVSEMIWQAIPEQILMQYSFVPKLLICCHENLTELHLWVNHKESFSRDSTIGLPHPCWFVTLHLYLADHFDFSQCQGSLQIPVITLFHYKLYDCHCSRSLQLPIDLLNFSKKRSPVQHGSAPNLDP